MSSSEPLSRQEVARRRAMLQALQEEAAEEEVPLERWSYRMAACVLSTFDPQTLQPMSRAVGPGGALRWLMNDCEVVTGTASPARWMLKEPVRREAIARLGSHFALREALRCNPVEAPDPLQELISRYLETGPLPEMEFTWSSLKLNSKVKLTDKLPVPPEDVDRVTRLLQVVRWLGPQVEGPERTTRLEAILSQRLANARLLAPFRKLAGDTFRGRQDELETLRVHVGVLDSSVTKTLSSYARRIVGMGDGTTLLIHGPGGMGKSALLARFVLEHHSAVPFAYLDFDNPQLSLDKPATLLLEASRQLALQYPDSLEALSAFEARCRKALGEERQRRTDGTRRSARDIWVPLAEEFGALLMTQVLNRWAEQGGPFLLLLDTFEEVQYRSTDLIRELEQLLGVLRRGYPQLRVVLSGRAPEPRLKATELVLKELDEASALSLLEASGVGDEALRRGLHAQVGGNPLSLKLAAEVARKEGAEAGGLRNLKTRRLFFFAAREAVVQGQLYRRVLEHVHDPTVRKLAHPGLIVRRLTPEVIQEVLAEPCGLGELTFEQALALFEQLQREVSLVSLGPDGALYHRPDVRRVMLEPLRVDQPAKVAAIHDEAVRYYAQQQDVVSRAEELYHRMACGQSREEIDPRWMPGVEPYLRSSLEELPAEVQAYACSFLGVDLPKKVWEQAQLVDWERHVVRRLKDLLLKGEPQWALEVLRERRERTPGSVLYVIEARVHILLGHRDEAERLIEEGLDSAGWAADSVIVLKLLLLRALLVAARQELPGAVKLLEDADRYAAERVCEPARVLPLMASVQLWRMRGNGTSFHLDVAKKLAGLLLRLSTDDLHKAPRLFLRALDLLREELSMQPGESFGTLRSMMAELENWSRIARLVRDFWDAAGPVVPVVAASPRGPRVLVTSSGAERGAAIAEPLARLLSPEVMAGPYRSAFQGEAGPTLKPPEGMSFGPLGFLLELMS
ncbi:ATP-binding protein [Pyxidicoccus sp. MSG2]|uniref:ATP-binding protein n=1 Tax=Pyxidicoccus sp. MSG2 TaxID=2996790 RepID=UPI00226E9039|nr:ATP-binding protein [Pyxidicoccus sp. MSG2]MCY1018024.1 ATP-binding protein [Pyxidicoccus sp. MSG2]